MNKIKKTLRGMWQPAFMSEQRQLEDYMRLEYNVSDPKGMTMDQARGIMGCQPNC